MADELLLSDNAGIGSDPEARRRNMATFVQNLFMSEFMPQGYRNLWRSDVVWLHVVSDSLILLACFSIGILLVYFVYKRRDYPYPRVFLLLGGFIIACGATHLMEVWIIWHGPYWLTGFVKAGTAVFAISAAILLSRRIPKALPLRGAQELARLNDQLQNEIAERQRAESALREAHDQLECRVQERSDELAKANAALQIEIAERTRAEEELNHSLREKDLVLKEIHHRVKNNLQVVSSLLSLQSGYIKNPKILAMLREDQTRVQTMALVHEKLCRSPNASQIEFGEYLQNLAAFLIRAFGVNPKTTVLITDVDQVHLGVDSAIPCGLIVNELVSNSLKYAFADGRAGEIRIALHLEANRTVTLVVGDNGRGLPPGLDVQHTETLGLQLVHTLVGQLHGTLAVRTEAGTEFQLQFVESNHKPSSNHHA